jgi:hypothetical protein
MQKRQGVAVPEMHLSVCLSVCLCYSMALGWTLAAVLLNLETMQRPEYLKTPNQRESAMQPSPCTVDTSAGNAPHPQPH